MILQECGLKAYLLAVSFLRHFWCFDLASPSGAKFESLFVSSKKESLATKGRKGRERTRVSIVHLRLFRLQVCWISLIPLSHRGDNVLQSRLFHPRLSIPGHGLAVSKSQLTMGGSIGRKGVF